MKKVTVLLVLGLFLLGCSAGSVYLKDFRRDVENARQAEEGIFEYTYKDVFLALVQVVNDIGAAIYVKDFDNGVLLAMGTTRGAYPVSPSTNFGFWLEHIDSKKTKVILRIAGVKWLAGATAEDVFHRIEKELEFRDKIK